MRCCASVQPDSETESRIQSLARGGPDWRQTARLAADHGITGLLYRNLRAVAWEAVPGDFQHHLTEANRAAIAAQLHLNIEFFRLLERFRQERIPVTPIKGPVAEFSLYQDLAVRSFSDLDFLVQPDDVARASALLTREGYTTRADVPASRQAAFLRHQHEFTFRRTRDQTLVEIQWQFAQWYFTFPLDFQAAWSRRQSIIMNGTSLEVLSPEDFLIYLCGHGLKHLWQQMKWVCDIAELIRSFPQLDWDIVLERAREGGGARMLALGLLLAVELPGACLPREVAARAEADATARALAREVVERMAAGTVEEPGLAQSLLFPLRGRERTADRARYCLRLALRQSPEDWRFVRLPLRLSFLYPLVRPIRLVRARMRSAPVASTE